jgi:hypothetical protein
VAGGCWPVVAGEVDGEDELVPSEEDPAPPHAAPTRAMIMASRTRFLRMTET